MPAPKHSYLLPTPAFLASREVEMVLARRRVRRGHTWTTTGYRPTQGYGDLFLISHGLMPDEHVSKAALDAAWEELSGRLAFAAFKHAA